MTVAGSLKALLARQQKQKEEEEKSNVTATSIEEGLLPFIKYRSSYTVASHDHIMIFFHIMILPNHIVGSHDCMLYAITYSPCYLISDYLH